MIKSYNVSISESSLTFRKHSSGCLRPKSGRLCRCWIKWARITNSATVCLTCCCLTSDTEVSAAVPPDYRAAPSLRLWDSWSHPQHFTIKNIHIFMTSRLFSHLYNFSFAMSIKQIQLSLDYTALCWNIINRYTLYPVQVRWENWYYSLIMKHMTQQPVSLAEH